MLQHCSKQWSSKLAFKSRSATWQEATLKPTERQFRAIRSCWNPKSSLTWILCRWSSRWMDPIQHPDRLQAGCALAWTLTPSLRQKKCENPLEKQNLWKPYSTDRAAEQWNGTIIYCSLHYMVSNDVSEHEAYRGHCQGLKSCSLIGCWCRLILTPTGCILPH